VTEVDRRWRVLAITSLGVFMASLDLFIVNIAFPDIQADFAGASLADLSWVLNAYAIVFAALLVPAGRVADRIGRKRVFIAGLLTFTLGSGASALAGSVPFLVGARVLQATGGAMMMPASLGLVLPAFPAAQRPVAVGIWSAVGGVAAALGPPLGGLLVALSWRWIFLVNVPIGLIVAVVALRSLDEVREPTDERRPDAIGAAVFALAIALLTGAIVQGPDWGWSDPRIVAGFAGSALLLGGFLLRSARHPAPVIELPLLRVRSFAMGNLAALAFFAGFGAMLLSGVLLLTEVWRYSVLDAGLAMAPGPLMAAFFAAPGGRLGARFGQRYVAAAGGLAFAASFAILLESVGTTPHYASDFLPGFLLGGAGVGLTLGTLPAAVTASLPPDRFATGTAVFGMSRQLGSAIGVAVLIAILADPSPAQLLPALRDGWRFAAGAGLAAALSSFAIGPVSQRVETSPQPEAGLAAAPARS
jgi:EmrB/QacA subfamily drug resistance transporter